MDLVRLTLHVDAFGLAVGGAWELFDDQGRRTHCEVPGGWPRGILATEAAEILCELAMERLDAVQLSFPL